MNATVHIRNEDVEKWKALENKSEFVHNALSGNALDAYIKAGGDPEFVISSKKDLESQFGTKPKKLDLNRMADEVLRHDAKKIQTMEPVPKSFSARKKK